MTLSFRPLATLLASGVLAASAASTGSPSTPFAPLEAWEAAVASGDASALAKIYAAEPPAKIMIGNNASSSSDDIRFWTGLKSGGISDVQFLVLSLNKRADQAQLVMRVRASRSGPDGSEQRVVMGLGQGWAREGDAWKLVSLRRSAFQPDPGRTLPEPTKPNTRLYPPVNEAESDLQQGLTAAEHEHKRVLVVFGANWCYDCHVLDTTFHSAAFAPLVNDNYVVVHVNVGDSGEENKTLAQSLGVAIDKGIPGLAVLNPDRTVVSAQRNGEFEDTKKIGPSDVRSFLEQWKPAR